MASITKTQAILSQSRWFLLMFPLLLSASYGDHLKVVLQGGQSNALGRAPTSGLSTTPVNLQLPQNDVVFYHGTTLTTLRPGTGRSSTEFGPEVTFGRAIADAAPTVKYAIVKYAAGGTNLYNQWNPQTGTVYETFRNTVTAGLAALHAAGHTTEIVGMIWHQGENDALDGQNGTYDANLTNFIADIRQRYGANLPFVIGEIRYDEPRNSPAFKAISDAQKAVAARLTNCAFIAGNDLTFFDRFHFDASGQMILGRRFAEAFLNLVTLRLQITPASAPETGFHLEWDSRQGERFRLRSSTLLSAPPSHWSSIVTEIVATPPRNRYVIAADGARRFFTLERM
jgi:hypothetical protein